MDTCTRMNYIIIDADLYTEDNPVHIPDNVSEIYVQGDKDIIFTFKSENSRNISVKKESKEPKYGTLKCATCRQLINLRMERGPTRTYKYSSHHHIKDKGSDAPCQQIFCIQVCVACEFAKCNTCQELLGKYIKPNNDTFTCETCCLTR